MTAGDGSIESSEKSFLSAVDSIVGCEVSSMFSVE